jgi:hypothetical protein
MHILETDSMLSLVKASEDAYSRGGKYDAIGAKAREEAREFTVEADKSPMSELFP